jgi:D-xylose reductase
MPDFNKSIHSDASCFQSEKVERIGQNISLFDFALTPDDLEVMAKLEKGMRFNDAGDFCETAFNTFCPIYD